jgi:hypothetical protein
MRPAREDETVNQDKIVNQDETVNQDKPVIFNDNLFFSASPGELAEGVRTDAAAGLHTCLICYASFEDGRVYEIDGCQFSAGRASREHVRKVHGSTAKWLSSLDKRLTGLTDTQRLLFECMMDGLDDKDTASRMSIAPSTVRNHRFQMRERERQAHVFLALMTLLERIPTQRKPQDEFMAVKRSAVMVDERYAVTQKEFDDVISKYFPDGPDGVLKEFPGKEKRKLAILTHLSRRFEPGVRYTEKQLTEILKIANDDYATLRRYLVEYGFLDRERDGSAYWLKC